MTVSPLALPTWDKLLLEPFSARKNMLYLVLCPDAPQLTSTLKTFFKNLSVTYKVRLLII